MIRTTSLAVVLIAAAAFAMGLATSLATRPDRPPSPVERAPNPPWARWLRLSPEQTAAIRQHDPGFQADLRDLRSELDAARNALIELFADDAAADDQIREQVERVIALQARIERRVTEHLLTVRDHLTSAQRRQFLELCADGVRHARRHRFRGGRGDDMTPERRRGPGNGGGWRGGRGHGPGG